MGEEMQQGGKRWLGFIGVGVMDAPMAFALKV